MQSTDPEERLLIYQKRPILLACIWLTFIFTALIYSLITLDISRVRLDLTKSSMHDQVHFFNSVEDEFSNQTLLLAGWRVFHSALTVTMMFTGLGFQYYALYLQMTTKIPPPKHPQFWQEFNKLFEKLPETIEGGIRFHRVRLIACVFIGVLLDYYMWLWGEVETHLLSIKSLFDILLLNSRFIPKDALRSIYSGELIVAFHLSFIFYFNIALIVFGYIVTLLFAGHLGRVIFLSRPRPPDYY